MHATAVPCECCICAAGGQLSSPQADASGLWTRLRLHTLICALTMRQALRVLAQLKQSIEWYALTCIEPCSYPDTVGSPAAFTACLNILVHLLVAKHHQPVHKIHSAHVLMFVWRECTCCSHSHKLLWWFYASHCSMWVVATRIATHLDAALEEYMLRSTLMTAQWT